MKYIKLIKPYLIGIVIGALLGFLYWKFIGCNTGTCPITSSPLISTAYGAFMGIFIGGIFKKEDSTNK